MIIQCLPKKIPLAYYLDVKAKKKLFFKVVFTPSLPKKQSRILKQKPFDGILSRLWRVLQIEYSKKKKKSNKETDSYCTRKVSVLANFAKESK